MKKILRDNKAKVNMTWILIGGAVFALATGMLWAGNPIQNLVSDITSGSFVTGDWSGGEEGNLNNLVDVKIQTVTMGDPGSGVTADSVELYDMNFNPIASDSTNDASIVEILGLPQNKNVYVFAEDTLSYDTLVKRTVPSPGALEKDYYSMKPDIELPVKMTTGDVDDYCIYGGADIAGGNYNFTTNGQTPTWSLELVATPASCQDEVYGASYIEPVQGYHYASVVVLTIDQQDNRVISPGWTKIPGLSSNYWYKVIDPWLCDYLPDGTYSQTELKVPVQLEITNSDSNAATVIYNFYDEQCLEDLENLDFGTSFDTGTVTIQD